jgi:hypothetical protein
MKEDYDIVRKRYADLMASHTGTVHSLELSKVYRIYQYFIIKKNAKNISLLCIEIGGIKSSNSTF